MKIAKKVLAVVMALGLILTLSAVAFAASPKVVLTPGDVNAKGVQIVTLNFVNCEGLKSFDFVLTGDAAFKVIKDGDDIAPAKDGGNVLTYEVNAAEGKVSGYFKEHLYTTAEWATAAEDNLADTAVSDGGNFKAFQIYFSGIDATKATKVTLSGTMQIGNDKVDVNEVVTLVKVEETTTEEKVETTTEKKVEPTTEKKVEPTTEKKVEPTTEKKVVETTTQKKVEEKTTETQKVDPNKKGDTDATEATKAVDESKEAEEATTVAKDSKEETKNVIVTEDAKKGDGTASDVNTGDSMVLAAAAGVVALAGAAFIVSKKRKY